jgi:integrase
MGGVNVMNISPLKLVQKLHGFSLRKDNDPKFASGFHYSVVYKDPETGKFLSTHISTNTDDEQQAIDFAIYKRDELIKAYKERKANQKTKIDNRLFFVLLKNYYRLNSEYLKDDQVNGARTLPYKMRNLYQGIIERELIPFLQSNNVNSFSEITRKVFSDFKIYLQERYTIRKNGTKKRLTIKTINNYIQAVIRILKYAERNELIQKLPFSKGTTVLKTNENEIKKQAGLLPLDYLRVFDKYSVHFHTNSDIELHYLKALSALSSTCGLRDSEAGRIKRQDIVYVESEGYYYVNVYNNKTKKFNRTESEKYRKIILHPLVIEILKDHILKSKIERDDYLFGISKQDKETKIIDGYLHWRKSKKAINFFYKQIYFWKSVKENNWDIEKSIKDFDIKKMKSEMTEKNITFYSFRHTFNTLLGGANSRSDCIDYFMGHKFDSAMRQNYTHIDQIDSKTFYDEYGKFLIDKINKYFFPIDSGIENLEKINIPEDITENIKAHSNNNLSNSEEIYIYLDCEINFLNVKITTEQYINQKRKKESTALKGGNIDDFFTVI